MDDAEKPVVMKFELLRVAAREVVAGRLGRLSVEGRHVIETPGYLGTTSRGMIPHLTPDNLSEHARGSGAYYALEDCE